MCREYNNGLLQLNFQVQRSFSNRKLKHSISLVFLNTKYKLPSSIEQHVKA